MNTYQLVYTTGPLSYLDKGATTAGDFVAGIVIGNTLSPNFQAHKQEIYNGTKSNVNTVFTFDLPFALGNLTVEPIVYDTRFQAVKEFLDKPYAVAGRVVAFLFDTTHATPYDWKKDFDNYMRYPAIDDAEELDLVIGVCNGTLTESYQPFGATGTVVGNGLSGLKIFDPKDLNYARMQDVLCQTKPTWNAGGGRSTSTGAEVPR